MKHIYLLALLCFAFYAQGQNYRVDLKSGSFTPPARSVKEYKWSGSDAVNDKYYCYMQFYTIPTDMQKAKLKEAGIELHDYIPNNVYLASISNPAGLQKANTEDIRCIIPIQATHKLTADLAKGKYPSWAKRGGNKIELMVQHMPGMNAGEVEMLLKAQGVHVTHTLNSINVHRVIVNTSDVKKLAALPYIYFIEPAPDKPQPENLVGRTNHRSNTLATDYKTGLKFDGSGVNVALNDDGIIGPHLDYKGRIENTYISFDYGNHGDHCAGILFGAGNRDQTTRGMASGATLGVYGVDATFPTYFQAFDSMDKHYVSKNIRITSTSYGDGNNAGYTSLARLMDLQTNMMPDLIHVFSTGNSGTANYGYGAGTGWGNITGGHKQAKSVLSVGNLDYLDNLASSSSRGPATDGRIKPDICAVGTNVYSTMDPNTYQFQSGTSMACPAVAGTLAQLYQAYKQSHSGQNPPSALMKALILNTADDLGNPGPDYKFGWGRINARRAYDVMNNNQYMVDSVSHGGTRTHTLTVPAGVSELRVMVYWQDKEASAGAIKALVNNLDMKLIDPSSIQTLPWILNPTPNPGGLNANAVRGVDTLNNMEQVTLANPTAGSYTVSVNGLSVPFGPQKYYVVYEFVMHHVTLTYPIGGESLVPGTQETIRWDASVSANPFTLEYTTNGSTWNTIATGISASSRSLNWVPPAAATGKAQVRITRGTVSDVSDAPFSIIGMPGVTTVNWVCADSFKVTYGAVTGATGYVISMLGDKYMDSVAFSNTTSCVVKGVNTTAANWFSVHAVGPDNAVGRRRVATTHPVVPFNCSVPTDVAAMKPVSPDPYSIIGCATASSTVPVAFSIKNFSLSALSNITVKYSVDGGTPVSEVFAGPLAPQVAATHSFSTSALITTAGTHIIRAWAEYAGDAVPGNDTIVWTKTIMAPPKLALPILQNMESFTLCDTAANCGQGVCNLGTDWLNAINGNDDNIDWRTHAGPTPSQSLGTGPVMDHTPGTATGKYLYLEATGCPGKSASLISPCIDLSWAITADLKFAYHMYGAGAGELHVDVFADGIWTHDIMPPVIGDQGNLWKTATVPLNSYLGKVINVRFRGITGSSETSDIALDAINITDPLSVEKTTGTAADVQIFPNPSDGSFNVRFSKVTEDVDLSVMDIRGNVVAHQRLVPCSTAVIVPLHLKDKPAGVYFLSVKDGTSVVNKKLIKL